MAMTFEWDNRKASTNATKHGITFAEAATVFADPDSLTITDPVHSQEEERLITLGRSSKGKFLVVFHTERGANHQLQKSQSPREKDL